ncbi:MAG: glycosyl hydrolase-related protein, partial [Lentisphaeria bacterium]|nr:glycosyl hydrolase-related protein [Lentisphaeria bacterium]
GGSQPQLYQFVKDNYPALYEKVRKAVKAGRWECQGGMWVEADNSLPSGESLIRQFMHGKNFFMDEFGVDVRNLWLPDVFGYNGNTPQLCRICGCSTFLTQKLSWNNINTFPYNTFRWQGIDGSEVVTHFPPENNYNSSQDAASLAAAQDRYQEAAVCSEFMSLFGIGDGGGGPREDFIEKSVIASDMEGLPRVKMGFAQPVLDRMEAMKDRLPVWRGELYFEKHRATLTTQARTKRNNRKLEQRLLQAEFINALLPAKKYPREALDRVCKTLLINQFHDIIPGSSIKLVYDNTQKEHAECLTTLEKLINRAGKALFKANENALTFFNSLSTDYTRPVELPKAWAKGTVRTADGKAVPTQVESDGRVFAKVTVPSDGFLTLLRNPKNGKAVSTKCDGRLVLENDSVRCEFAKNGQLKSAVDKLLDVETLAAPGNVLGMYADDPADYDAWDLDPWYRKQYLCEAKAAGEAVRECGPVRSVIRFRLTIGNSEIDQEAVLASDGAAVEFNTQVEWNEGRKMLRVAFPTNLNAAEATYDIQYGMIRRPTHTNTTWDSVQFEVCGQRYADLSDCQRGFAIMNDCKYGHMIRDGIVELNLLRSPKWPDYTADLGHHAFTYAIRPHQGTVVQAPIYTGAAQLNREPWRFDGFEANGAEAPVAVSGEGVSLEVVKRAEKSDDIIVRIVETRGMKTTGSLRIAKSCKAEKVFATNAIEWTEEGEFMADQSGAYNFSLNPFQILTLKLK